MRTALTRGTIVAAALGALALTPVSYAADALPGDGKTLQPARATWDTGWWQEKVYAKALEELGYTVQKPKTLDNPIFFQAVAQGDVDYWVNGWFPIHNTYIEQPGWKDSAEVIGYVAKGGALQGYLVDKKSAEAYGITNLEDFKKPEIREAFDSNGDGKADMVACPPGWGCELVIAHQMDAYELGDSINTIKAAYSASMADVIARYQEGNPVLFYTWTPNWTVGILKPGTDVVWIETPFPTLPDDQKQYEDRTTVEGVAGCVEDPCEMGWPVNDIQPVANSQFLEENPAVKRLLEVASIPLDDIFAQNAMMFEGQDSEEDLEQQADDWIAENQDLFDSWIEQAMSAAAS